MYRFFAWVEAEQGRFFLLLPIAMGSAILFYFSLPFEPPTWPALTITCLSLPALLAGWRWPFIRFIAACTLAASFGFYRAEWRTASFPPLLPVPYGVSSVSGQLISINPLPTGRRITIYPAHLGTGPALARSLHVKLPLSETTPLTTGDHILLRAILFTPDRPAYPGGWDTGRDEYFANVGAAGFALGHVGVTAQARHSGFAIRLRALREAIAATITTCLPVSTGSIAVTLLTGLSSAIPPVERQNFTAAGLAHLLAVAGLHVGIIMGLVFTAWRFLLSRFEKLSLYLPVKPLAALAALVAGGGYAVLTGAHLPILRSLAMAALVTGAVIAGRRAVSRRALAIAALALMLATPETVISASFQMSFSAVLALICGYEALSFPRAHLPHSSAGSASNAIHGTARHVGGLFVTSLLAGGASMPFAAYQFHQIQPYWILANLLAVPITAFWVMPLGLAALSLMPLGLSWLALVPMGWGIGIIVWLTGKIAAWPGAMLTIPPISSTAILLFASGLVWLCLWRTRLRLGGVALMAAALALSLTARAPNILVSADSRLIAIHSHGSLWLLRQPKASRFVLGQWQTVWPGLAFLPFTPGSPGTAGLVMSQPASCPAAHLILAPFIWRGTCQNNAPNPPPLIIDRLYTYHYGAIAIWLRQGRVVRLQSDRGLQGNRPWVPPWPDS